MREITPTNYINQGKKYLFDYVEKRFDSLKKHRVLTSRILKRYKDDATFLMKVKIPGEAEPSVQTVRSENSADNSRLPRQSQSKQAKK